MYGNESIQVSNELPSGKWANVRCYDDGGKTFDRYTVVYMDQPETGKLYKAYACLGMSNEPFDQQGFGQHSTAMIGHHLGKRVPFDSLPKDCQRAVLNDLRSE